MTTSDWTKAAKGQRVSLYEIKVITSDWTKAAKGQRVSLYEIRGNISDNEKVISRTET